ncbi:putative dehydrogenase [Nitrospirillum amazonense]|uniref:Putative dehydrogenase n=2 Tax=Nitrospirillum amazonense TaxID=28077 RepID=A0A560FJQ1_9PROT|nr:putative dehydrogenase [Nitrospirillum amazonense]
MSVRRTGPGMPARIPAAETDPISLDDGAGDRDPDTGGNGISRRLLMGLGAAGAGTLLMRPAVASPAAGPAEGEGVGFAVVGLGRLSQGQILPGFRSAKRAKLTALVSGHPDKAARLAAKHGVARDAIYTYETYDRIVDDPRIQVVYVVLPNAMHAEFTIRALKAGKHVLCEKPMATSVDDAEAMIAAAKAADRALMIAYRCHYEPLNLAAMRLIRSGKLGKPRMVVTQMGRQASLSDPADVWRLDMKMSGGGALADMGIYGINGARYLLNEEPVEVRAWAQTDRKDPRFREVEDLIAWQFRFPSGAVANGSTSFDYAPTMSYQVECAQGRLVADPGAFYNGNRLTVQSGYQSQVQAIHEIDQFAREMDWMADVVRGKAPLVSTGEEGLQDMRLMKAILDSVAQGGATVSTAFGYTRAVDPAKAVDVPA